MSRAAGRRARTPDPARRGRDGALQLRRDSLPELLSRSGDQILIAIAAAFALLAEAMIAIAAARNWHLSWWEWHALMAVAFGLVAFAAREEHRRGRSPFAGLYLRDTIARLDHRYAKAIDSALEGTRRRKPT